MYLSDLDTSYHSSRIRSTYSLASRGHELASYPGLPTVNVRWEGLRMQLVMTHELTTSYPHLRVFISIVLAKPEVL